MTDIEACNLAPAQAAGEGEPDDGNIARGLHRIIMTLRRLDQGLNARDARPFGVAVSPRLTRLGLRAEAL